MTPGFSESLHWSRLLGWSISLLALLFAPATSYTNPVDPSVIRGAAEFSNPAAGHLRIDQYTQRSVIDWRGFSIDAGELTEFRMPNSNSASLNRVTGTGQSIIEGRLQSNGNVYLLNSNGVIVGKNGKVDVGGFIASTLNLDQDEFMRGGDLHFNGSSPAPVVNLGQIGASGSDIYLVAPDVLNEGTLSAPEGRVGMAAGNDILLKVDGEERVFVRGASTKGGVINKGTVQATVAELKAHDGNVYGMAIQNEGRVNARSITREGGKIYLRAGGGKVRHSGSFKAATGRIVVDAPEVGITGEVSVSSETGKAGDISVTGRQIEVGNGATLSADTAETGDGGRVLVIAEDTLEFHGQVSANGGSVNGNGGFVELSGKRELYIDDLSGQISLNSSTGSRGTLLLDPIDVSIIDGVGGGVSGTTINDGAIVDFLTNNGSLAINTTGTGGSGNITVDSAVNITWFNASNLQFDADRSFRMNSGSVIASNGSGSITVNANAAGTTTGNFAGIVFDGATLTSAGSGSIALTGRGGDTDDANDGIAIQNSSLIQTTGTAAISLTGTSGGGTFANRGIAVEGSTVQSDAGAITMIGTGAGTDFLNDGIALGFEGTIATVSGAISLTGTSSAQATQSDNSGIRLDTESLVTSSGAGAVDAITLSGNAALSDGGSNHGVVLVGASGVGATVRSADANIFVNGVGGNGSSGFNDGIFLRENGVIESTGSGNITLNGTAGPELVDAGVDLFDSSILRTNTGSLSIQGSAAPGGLGIFTVTGSNFIESTGGGGITLIADQVHLRDVQVATEGHLVIAPLSPGTSIGLGGAAVGDVPGTLNLDDGMLSNLTGDFASITFGDVLSGFGAITVAPMSFGSPVTFASPGPGGSVTTLGAIGGNGPASLTFLTTNGGTRLGGNLTTEGDPIFIDGALELDADVTLDSTGLGDEPGGANVTVTGDITGAISARNLTINAGADGLLDLGGNIGGLGRVGTVNFRARTFTYSDDLTAQGNIFMDLQHNLVLNGGSLGNGAGVMFISANSGALTSFNGDGILLDNNASISSNGGIINLIGTAGGVSGNRGVAIDGAGTIANTGTGSISVTGSGNSNVSASNQSGIAILDGTVSTVNGTLTLAGLGGGNSALDSGNVGLLIASDSAAHVTGTGLLDIFSGGGAGSSAFGIQFQSGDVRVHDGTAALHGTGGPNGSNAGIFSDPGTGGSVLVTGNGSVTLTGTATGSAHAIDFQNPGATIGGVNANALQLLSEIGDLNFASRLLGNTLQFGSTLGNLPSFVADNPLNDLNLIAGRDHFSVTYVDANSINVGSFGPFNGLDSTGNKQITALTGVLTVDAATFIHGGDGSDVFLNANGTGAGDGIAILGTVSADSGGNVTLTSANNIAVSNGNVSADDVTLTASRTISGFNGSIFSDNGIVSLTATGAATGSFNGLDLQLFSISTDTGTININAIGGTGSLNHGINLNSGAQIFSTGTGSTVGSITVNAAPNASGGLNYHGIEMFSGSSITSVDADIFINGVSNGTGFQNIGARLIGGSIRTTGIGPDAGNILIQGTGGEGAIGQGIQQSNSSEITTAAGDIALTGTSVSLENSGEALRLVDGVIRSTNGGEISITGTRTINSPSIQTFATHLIDGPSSDVTLASLFGTTIFNGEIRADGLRLLNGSDSAAANFSLTNASNVFSRLAAGPTGSATQGPSLNINVPSPLAIGNVLGTAGVAGTFILLEAPSLTIDEAVRSTNGDSIFFITDDLTIDTATQIQGTGDLVIRQRTSGTAIALAGAAGALSLSQAEIDTFQNGFNEIRIGDINSGQLTTNAVTFIDPIVLESNEVVINGTIQGLDDASVSLVAPPTTIHLNGDILTEGNPISVGLDAVIEVPTVNLNTTLNGNVAGADVTIDSIRGDLNTRNLNINAGTSGHIAFGTANTLNNVNLVGGSFSLAAFNSIAVQGNLNIDVQRNLLLDFGSALSTATGDIGLLARGLVSGNYKGIALGNATVSTTGSGSIFIDGTGGNTGSQNFGVDLGGATIRTSSGTIDIAGTGGGDVTGSENLGIGTTDLNLMLETTSGDINLNGQGGDGITTSIGVKLEGSSLLIGSTAGGNISILGTAGATGDLGFGVELNDGVTLSTDGSGSIAISGLGGGSNNGIGLSMRGSSLSVVDGSIDLEGFGGANGDNNHGIRLSPFGVPTSILSTGSGNIELRGAAGTGAASLGLNFGPATGTIGGPAATGTISLLTDSLSIAAGTFQSSGSLVLNTLTPGGNLSLSSGVNNLADGFAEIVIGDLGSGTVNIGAVTFFDPVNISGQTINVNGQITGAGNASITLNGPLASTHLNADIVTSGNVITINDAIVLGADVKIDSTNNGLFAGADISVSGIIEGDGQLRNLTIDAGPDGNVFLFNDVGQSDFVNDIKISGRSFDFANLMTAQGILLIDAMQNISLTGALLEVGDGDLTLNANLNGLANGGFHGVLLDNAVLSSSGAGDISLTGSGGTGSVNQTGVFVGTGSQILSTSSGAISLTGQGGSSLGSFDHGIVVTDSGTLIRSSSGDITMTGTGGGISTNDFNNGIVVSGSAVIESVGTGAGAATITLDGTATVGSDDNNGLFITSTIRSIDGAIMLSGQGGGTGNFSDGIDFNTGGLIESLGIGPNAATISLNGIGGAGLQENHGVFVASQIRSTDGDILIQGNGTGSGNFNRGVELFSNGSIQSMGTGANAATITLIGTGADGNLGNRGIQFSAGGTPTVTSIDGDIQFIGTGGNGPSGFNQGIIFFEGLVRSTGLGSINMNATGVGGNSQGFFTQNVTIESTGSGDISLTASGSGTAFDAFVFGGTGTSTLDASAGIGNVTITSDSVTIGSSSSIAGTNSLTIQPLSPGASIGLGDTSTGTLNLNNAEIVNLANGFNSITIGDTTDGSGQVDIRTVTFFDPVVIAVPESPGRIFVNGLLTGQDNASIHLIGPEAPFNTTVFLNNDILTFGNAVTVSDSLVVTGDRNIVTNGGDITLEGPVNGDNPTRSLTLNAGTSGHVTLSGSLGGSVPLNLVNITAGSFFLDNLFAVSGFSFVRTVGDILLGTNAALNFQNGFELQADSDGDGAGSFASLGGSTITSGGSNLTLTAADVSLDGQINLGPGQLDLLSSEAGVPMVLGDNAGLSFDISAAELNRIAAQAVVIGDFLNDITVNQALNLATFDTLELFSLTTLAILADITGSADLNLISEDVALNADIALTGDLFIDNAGTLTTSGNRTVTAGNIGVTGDIDTSGQNLTLVSSNALSLEGGTDVGSGTLDLTGGGFLDLTRVTADSLNVTGQAGDDVVELSGVPANLSVNGAGGNDTVSFASAAGPITTNLASYHNIDILQGSSHVDTLRGTSGDDSFNVTGDDEGNDGNGLHFFSFENLEGGDGDDTFRFVQQAILSGQIDGGANLTTGDSLRIDDSSISSDQTYTVTANQIIRNPAFNFSDIENVNVTTGSGNDTVNTNFFPFAQNFQSGGGTDTVTVNGIPQTNSPVTQSGSGSISFQGGTSGGGGHSGPDPVTEANNDVGGIQQKQLANAQSRQSGPSQGATVNQFDQNGSGSQGSSSQQLLAQNTTPAPSTSDSPAQDDSGNPPASFYYETIQSPGDPGNAITRPGILSIGGGGAPTAQIQTLLLENSGVPVELVLRAALGMEPTVVVTPFEGQLVFGLGFNGGVPTALTLALLSTSVSLPVLLEISQALGLPFEIAVSSSPAHVGFIPGTPTPGPQIVRMLDQSTDPQTASLLSLALGGNGTAPANSEDGVASINGSGQDAGPQTQLLLVTNLSVGALTEILVAMGGSGEVAIAPGYSDEFVTLDVTGTPPTPAVRQLLLGNTDPSVQAFLIAVLGLPQQAAATALDGPLCVSFDVAPSPALLQLLELILADAARAELAISLTGN